FSLLLRPPPSSPLFPYTTLFRSIYDPDKIEADRELLRRFYLKHGYIDVRIMPPVIEFDPGIRGFVIKFIIEEGEQFRVGTVDVRSEEHTSELQSPCNLVCRLLLE